MRNGVSEECDSSITRTEEGSRFL